MNVSYSHLPRWRGFNLQEKLWGNMNARFLEDDFKWIADWGFDFVRLALNYRCYVERGDWTKFREDMLKEIDEAVDLGRRYSIHVNLNIHRAPGYFAFASPPETLNLWESDEALDVNAQHWVNFARRYKGIPNEELSFNLLNEPAQNRLLDMPRPTLPLPVESYVHVIKRLVEAVRGEDPGRLIIADGLQLSKEPVFELADLKIAQSTHCYVPLELTHYKAYWFDQGSQIKQPNWPMVGSNQRWDKDSVQRECIKPWKELEARGVGVHVGEFGVYNVTPHQVALSWMRDCLENIKEAGWGWALWNFRGDFGILDSKRHDVPYEDWHGHWLDRAMLELLQSY